MNMLACSVCFFNAPEDLMNISLRAGILALLAVLVVVLGLFTKFFLGVRRRAKLMS